MEIGSLNRLLAISFTSKEIQFALKRFTAEKKMDIPAESLGVLLAVYYLDSDTIQQDIADVVKKDKSAVLRQIDHLEKKNLLQRITDPEDRRKNIIRITKTGTRVVDEIHIQLNELYAILSEGIETADLETFHKVLDHFRMKARTL